MNARSRLGKGLSALIQGADQVARIGDKEVLEIRLDSIEFNPDQPRKNIDDAKLQELAASIREVGVLQPVLVRKASTGEDAEDETGPGSRPGGDRTTYSLVAGERRVRAARLAGLDKMPALVCGYEETEALKIALLENIQREDLGPVEEATAYRDLVEAYGATQEELASMLGKSRSGIANSLRLLSLQQEILALLEAGSLTRGHAKVLLGVENETFRVSLARLCGRRGLSVRECEQRAKRGPAGTRRKTRRKATTPSGESGAIRALRERCEAVLGTPVRIDCEAGSGKGTVNIRFFSNDDLERVLQKMGVDTDLS